MGIEDQELERVLCEVGCRPETQGLALGLSNLGVWVRISSTARRNVYSLQSLLNRIEGSGSPVSLKNLALALAG